MTPPAGAAAVVDARVEPTTDGTYVVTFVPVAAGDHAVRVAHAASGVAVLRGHVITVAAGAAEPSWVSITGAGAYGGVAGETLAFTAAAKDAYGTRRRGAVSRRRLV